MVLVHNIPAGDSVATYDLVIRVITADRSGTIRLLELVCYIDFIFNFM